MLTKPSDAFRGQSRSPNIVPFDIWFPISDYSNFILRTHRFWDIRLVSYSAFETRVRGHSTSSEPVCIDPPHDFLLTFYSNQGPISYHFRDERQFQSKIAKFSHLVYFAPPLKGFPWNWVPALGVKNLEWWATGLRKKLTISSAMWIQYTNTPTWQTDGHRTTAKTSPTHSVAR